MKKNTHYKPFSSTKRMTVMIMFILFSVFFVGTISAFEFDNKLTYSENDLKVNFRNSFLLIPTTYIGTVELKSHNSVTEIKQFGYGKEEVVMYYDFSGFKEIYENGLGKVYFTDKRNNEEIEKDYSFVYWTNVTEIKNKMGDVLVGYNINGTGIYESKIIGTYEEEVWKWIDYNSKNIPSGNIRIGIKTFVDKGDRIDGVWTIAGKKIEKHAVWTSGLNVGLVSYYPLNETSGTNAEDVAGTRDLTHTNGATVNQVGIIGRAVDYNGVNEYSIMASALNLGTGDFAVSMWVDVDVITGTNILFDFGYNNLESLSLGILTDGSLTWVTVDGNVDSNKNIGTGGYQHLVMVRDGTTSRVYLDNSVSTNVTSAFLGQDINQKFAIGYSPVRSGANWGFNGRMDEVGLWNRTLSAQEVSDLFNGGVGITFTDNFAPIITLNSPIDNFNTSNSSITFNGTMSNDAPDNVTLFIDDVGNETNSTGILGEYLFTKLISEGTHTWNYESCNLFGCDNGTERTFTIDKSNPTINITFPTEIIDFHEVNKNLSVNWTVEDLLLDTCILQFEGVNKTITCNDNQTQINITNSINKTIIFYANDTVGNVNSSSRSWDYKIFQNSINFSSSTIGGNTETFTLNITKLSSLQISLVNLIYNLSSSSATFTSGDNPIITKNLQIPNPSVDTNLSFFFSFLMSDSSLINTTSNNQTVLNFGIANCTTFTTLVYNFTMLDEENQTKLSDVTIEYAFNLTDKDRITQISNFSFESTENPTAICINQNLTAISEFSLDGVLKYKSLNGSFLTRYYNILNFSLTNSTIPNLINIYSVLESTATPFKLTFRDSSLTLSPDILVNVNKQFVASNDFKTVEIPITDTNGQTVLNLVRNTAIYNLIFTDIQGNIVASFNKVAAFCQDFTIGDCVLDLDAPSTTASISNISESLGISQIITYVNSTSTATMTFSSLTSEPITARIIGTTQNQFGNSTVCDNSLTSTLGTIECDASSILSTDIYLFIDVFSNGNYIETRVININPLIPTIGGNYGSNGFFVAFLIILTIIILFSDDKQTLLIMLGIGWAVVLVFGLVKGTIIGATSGGIWLLISIITMIWKLKKEEVGT